MTALKQFRTDVLIDVPGAPNPLVDREVRHAAREFCDFTFTWRAEVAAIDIATADAQYEFTLPIGARIVRIVFVRPGCGTRINDESCCISGWYYTPDGKVHIDLASETAKVEGLQFLFALKPDQDCIDVPDDLYQDHLEAIGHGAKARLFALAGKDWSNPQLASFHMNAFEAAKRKEKAEVINEGERQSTLAVRPYNYNG